MKSLMWMLLLMAPHYALAAASQQLIDLLKPSNDDCGYIYSAVDEDVLVSWPQDAELQKFKRALGKDYFNPNTESECMGKSGGPDDQNELLHARLNLTLDSTLSDPAKLNEPELLKIMLGGQEISVNSATKISTIQKSVSGKRIELKATSQIVALSDQSPLESMLVKADGKIRPPKFVSVTHFSSPYAMKQAVHVCRYYEMAGQKTNIICDQFIEIKHCFLSLTGKVAFHAFTSGGVHDGLANQVRDEALKILPNVKKQLQD